MAGATKKEESVLIRGIPKRTLQVIKKSGKRQGLTRNKKIVAVLCEFAEREKAAATQQQPQEVR